MTKTTRLNDLQLVLLSHAAKNGNGNVLPLPEAAARDEERTTRELKSLLRRELLAEVDVADRNQTWRTDDDRLFGLILTEAGQDALGLGAEKQAPEKDAHAGQSTAAPAPRPGSKIAAVVALLQRKEGATLDEMVKATGWQSHTARAALTGLRKKGHSIAKTKRDQTTCYAIAAEG